MRACICMRERERGETAREKNIKWRWRDGGGGGREGVREIESKGGESVCMHTRGNIA